MHDPNTIPDEAADAATIAEYEFVHGEDMEPLTRRQLGITRQCMKVAIAAALDEMSATERGLIGHVCEKGNHPSFEGETDHGTCGSHYYADIYVTVEKTRNGRGEEPDLDAIAKEIKNAFIYAERGRWDQ